MFNKDKFEGMLKNHSTTKQQLADYLGISKSYLYRKIKESGNFNVKEISFMINFFGREETLDCLFYCE